MIKSIERIVCGALLLAFLSCGDDAGETGPAGGRGLVTFTATAGDTGTRSTQEGTFEKGNAIGRVRRRTEDRRVLGGEQQIHL